MNSIRKFPHPSLRPPGGAREGTMKQLLCASFIGLVASATPIWANSCSNISTMGTYDSSGLQEYGSGILAVGTFRIEEEKDESKQPDFNLVRIDCNSVPGSEIFVCTMTQASVRANSEQPNADKQNCTLDLDITEYQLKEASPGVLSGSASSGICYNLYLIINRNSKRVYLNFTKTKDAYKRRRKKVGRMSINTQNRSANELHALGRSPQKYTDNFAIL